MSSKKWVFKATLKDGTTVTMKREPKRLLEKLDELLDYIEETPDVEIIGDFFKVKEWQTSKQ